MTLNNKANLNFKFLFDNHPGGVCLMQLKFLILWKVPFE